MRSISVVINARLTSTRLPQKLLRPFAGTSLIEISLEKLNQMDFFEHRYLAVAEDELKIFAKHFKNIKILHRDSAAVKKGVNPQKITFAHYLEVQTDYIFVFNPCLPFLSIETVRKAFEYFQSTNFPSYTSVVPTRDWIFDSEGNALTNTDPRNVYTNKGKIFYRAAHAFHIVNKEFFAKNGFHWTYTPNDPHLIQIPEEEAFDIDNEIEFKFVEYNYTRKKR